MSFRIHSIQPKKPIRRPLPWRAFLGMALLVLRPLYDLGKKFRERHEHEVKLKKAFAIGIAAVLALAVGLLAISLLISMGGISLSSAIKAGGLPVETDENGVTNILLLGQGDEAGQSLTDTIMVASIDPRKTDSVALLSIPRDFYLMKTEKGMLAAKGKLNEIWRDETIALVRNGVQKKDAPLLALTHLKDEVGAILGIEMHHAVLVDFAAFEQVIDAIGGITIDVPEAINDTEYPGPNYTYETFQIDAGRQHLDGKTTLKYARSRSTTSDFNRSGRQQAILHAAIEQAKEEGLLRKPSAIVELFGILANHVLTDLKTRQLVTLAEMAKEIPQDRLLSLQLNNVNGLYGEQQWKGGILYSPPRDLFEGEFVLLPVSMPEFPVTPRQIRVLTALFFGHRELFLEHPSFAVLNAGAPEGSAGRLGNELTKFGFEVTKTSNVPGKQEFPVSVIINAAEGKDDIASFLGELLGMKTETMTDDWRTLLADRAGEFTVILGEDFTFRTFQDLIPLP